jgi:hypothetical protein
VQRSSKWICTTNFRSFHGEEVDFAFFSFCWGVGWFAICGSGVLRGGGCGVEGEVEDGRFEGVETGIGVFERAK